MIINEFEKLSKMSTEANTKTSSSKTETIDIDALPSSDNNKHEIKENIDKNKAMIVNSEGNIEPKSDSVSTTITLSSDSNKADLTPVIPEDKFQSAINESKDLNVNVDDNLVHNEQDKVDFNAYDS